MNRLLAPIILAGLLLALAACGAGEEDSGRSLALQEPAPEQRPVGASGADATGEFAGYYAGGAPSVSPPFAGGYGPDMPGPFPVDASDGTGQDATPLARLSMEVDSVDGATRQVQSIAASLGGYVERLTSIGAADQARSEITIKVPQEQSARALDRIQGLGVVQYRSLTGADVTDRHVDFTARLANLQKEERSLASLLERSSSVAELLSVERELARVRTDIERAQWQLELLERQVDLAAIHVILFPRGAVLERGTAATFVLEVSEVGGSVARLRQFVAARVGEIDEVYLASKGEEERAEITFRIFADDLNRAAEFIEGQGRVTERELLDRPESSRDRPSQAGHPTARIHVTYLHRAATVSPWVPILIIVGLLILAGAVTYLMRLAYARGRRRGSFI